MTLLRQRRIFPCSTMAAPVLRPWPQTRQA